MSDKFVVNKRSDLEFEFNWPDGAGGNANLNGYVLSLVDVNPALDDVISTEFLDISSGLIRTKIEWKNSTKIGVPMRFRFLVQLGQIDKSTNALWVEYV